MTAAPVSVDVRKPKGKIRRWLRNILLSFVGFLLTLWSTAALVFDFPNEKLRIPLAIVFLIALVVFVWRAKGAWRRFGVVVLGFVIVLLWWRTLKASNDRNWQPDVAQTPWSEMHENTVTIHNIRDCNYRAEFDYTCQWKTRTIDLNRIQGMDFFITYWGSPFIAHPIISFDIAGQDPLPMSIETRKEVGEVYSAIRGFFRYYELIYIVSDERDVIRLRTNYRTGEEVYLFHTKASPELARAVFLLYLQRANTLREKPEWYNALTDNCTSNVAVHVKEAKRDILPAWDWRLLLNGKSDELLYDDGYLAGNLPYKQLKEQAHINPAARAANDDPNFWIRIRQGRAGFENMDLSVPAQSRP